MKHDDLNQQSSQSENESHLRAVVDKWLICRAAGQGPSEESLIEDHPQLMPRLGEQLRRAQRVRAAIRQALDDGKVPAPLSHTSPHSDSPSADSTLRIRCPQCHILLSAEADTSMICPGCQCQFSLLDNESGVADIGRRIGDFELMRPLGCGGFGTVWQARDMRLQRIVALKIPRFHHLAAEDLELFWREARAAAQLRHPHIVPVHEIGRDGATIYLVHDYIEGTNLAQRLADQPLTARESAALVATVADAIHYAHEAGIVHRDVKPSNILLDDELRPYVTDFGLAKRDAAEITVSTSGKVVGTPAYMSPEQAAGSEGVDGRSDVYSLGVILYELLTGELPFHGTAYSLIQRVIHDEPPHPQQLNSSIPRDLSTICLEAMARVPAHRYATAHELAEDLQRYLRGESVLARPPHVWERGWRWVRRRPALAGLWTAVCVAVLAIGGACAGLFYGRSLRASLDETEQQRRAAQVAQRHAEQFQYQRHISVSHSRITNGNMYGVDDLLDSCDPKSRNWEWRYLKRLGHDELRSFQGHDVFAVCIAIHPSGLKIAVGGCPEGTVKIWDLVTGRLLRILNGHTKDLWSVEYSPDGTHFASGGMDNTVRLWDGATGEPRHTLTHSGGVTCLAFSPDSRLVVSGSGDQTVKIWDAESGALFRELHGHVGRSVETSGVVGVSFSPDGKFLAAASRDQTVKIYEVSTSQELHTLREHTDRANSVAELSHAVAFSPDGSIVATSCHNAIRIWDWKAGKLLKTWPGHEGQIKALVFSSDSQLLASGGADQGLRLWNVTTGTEIACLRGHTSDIWSIAFHPNGRELYSSSGSENLIRVWDIQRALQSTMERRHDGPVYDVAFSPDGPFFASAGSRGEVRIWTLDSPQHIHELHCHDSEVRALAFSRDGRWLVTAGADRKAKVWNVTDWSAVSCHDEHTNEVRAIAVAPSVDRIASMSLAKADGIHIWNPLTGQTCVTLPSWLPWDTDISFSPDGRLLAAPNETDGRTGITLWDTMTARPRFRLPHDLGPWSITFSPNARMIATAGGEYSIKLWDTASGQLLRTLLGHSAAIYDLAFSPDGTRLASASLDQTVRLWDISSGGELLTLRGHDRIVYAVQFSPDGHWLVSAGGDGRILLWDARPMLESKPTQ